MQAEWVIGTYTGAEALKVKALADEGVGYIKRSEQGRGVSYEIEVAFRRPIDGPRPEHLIPADMHQVTKLEAIRAKRQGSHS